MAKSNIVEKLPPWVAKLFKTSSKYGKRFATVQDLLVCPIPIDTEKKSVFYGNRCVIGGKTQVHSDRDREKTLVPDQYTGTRGHSMGSWLLFGSLGPFIRARKDADSHELEGDDHTDFLGLNIDIKTTHWHSDKKALMHHELMVESETIGHEKGSARLYILAFWFQDTKSPSGCSAVMAGWVYGSELLQSKNLRAARYNLPVYRLHPMPLLRWKGPTVPVWRRLIHCLEKEGGDGSVKPAFRYKLD